MLVMPRVHRSQQEDCKQNIHRWAGNGDQEAVPARMRHELARMAAALVHGVLARHLHIPAERECVKAIIRVSPSESDQPFAKSNGELLDSHSQRVGYGVITKLADQQHESNDDVKVEQ